MKTNQSHQVVTILEGRGAGPKKNTDAILLLIGPLTVAACIAAAMLLRTPEALDTVVNRSVAAQTLFAPSDPKPTFHEVYPLQSGGDAGEWPTF